MAARSVNGSTHYCSQQPKQAWQFWKYFANKSIIWKILEGEMLTRSQTTTLLQILSELTLYSQVMFKSMKVADDTFLRNSKCEWVKVLGDHYLLLLRLFPPLLPVPGPPNHCPAPFAPWPRPRRYRYWCCHLYCHPPSPSVCPQPAFVAAWIQRQHQKFM